MFVSFMFVSLFVCFYCMFEFECFFWLLGPIDTHSPVWKTTVGTGRRRRRRRSWMWSRRCSNGEKLSSPCECDMFSYYELMCSKVMCFIVLVTKTSVISCSNLMSFLKNAILMKSTFGHMASAQNMLPEYGHRSVVGLRTAICPNTTCDTAAA